VSHASKVETPPKPLPTIETPEGRQEFVQPARDGDRSLLPLLRPLFDTDRSKGGIFGEICGNAFDHACSALVKHALEQAREFRSLDASW
jgi:hypothetical protein